MQNQVLVYMCIVSAAI